MKLLNKVFCVLSFSMVAALTGACSSETPVVIATPVQEQVVPPSSNVPQIALPPIFHEEIPVDTTELNENLLLGEWELSGGSAFVEMLAASFGNEVTGGFQIHADGTITLIGRSGDLETGTWETEEDILTITSPGGHASNLRIIENTQNVLIYSDVANPFIYFTYTRPGYLGEVTIPNLNIGISENELHGEWVQALGFLNTGLLNVNLETLAPIRMSFGENGAYGWSSPVGLDFTGSWEFVSEGGSNNPSIVRLANWPSSNVMVFRGHDEVLGEFIMITTDSFRPEIFIRGEVWSYLQSNIERAPASPDSVLVGSWRLAEYDEPILFVHPDGTGVNTETERTFTWHDDGTFSNSGPMGNWIVDGDTLTVIGSGGLFMWEYVRVS